MVYIIIDERKRKGKSLLRFLKSIDEKQEFIDFMDDTQDSPCRYTDAEKRQRIAQSVADAKAGLGVSQEKMINRHPQWK